MYWQASGQLIKLNNNEFEEAADEFLDGENEQDGAGK